MTQARVAELRDFYHRELTCDIIPFWLKHGIDREKGGLMDFLDREGNPLSTDKGGWAQGRATWTFSALYNRLVKSADEWLAAAHNPVPISPGTRFWQDLMDRAYFEMDRDGRLSFSGDTSLRKLSPSWGFQSIPSPWEHLEVRLLQMLRIWKRQKKPWPPTIVFWESFRPRWIRSCGPCVVIRTPC